MATWPGIAPKKVKEETIKAVAEEIVEDMEEVEMPTVVEEEAKVVEVLVTERRPGLATTVERLDISRRTAGNG